MKKGLSTLEKDAEEKHESLNKIGLRVLQGIQVRWSMVGCLSVCLSVVAACLPTGFYIGRKTDPHSNSSNGHAKFNRKER